MKTKVSIFLLLSVILLSLLSCTHDVKPKGVSFDKAEFSEQKEKWHSAQIKNYSFDYSFGSYGGTIFNKNIAAR